jgi:Domain of unknown function (DUF4383)
MEASRDLIERALRVGRQEGTARTIAQSFCLLFGAGLIAGGVLGFVFGGASFDTGGDVQGDDLAIFEVNGWHNVVHIVSGACLVVASMRAASAALGALIFGAVYAGIAVWGFTAGDSVAGLVATDTDANWLHVGFAAAGGLVGLLTGALGMSARREHRRLITDAGAAARAPTPARRAGGRRFLRRAPKKEAADREPSQATKTGGRQ